MGDVVFDIETKNSFAEAGSSRSRDLDISLVGIYVYEADQYLAFRDDELDRLWPYMYSATRLIGYNSKYFDIPLLEKYAPRPLTNIPHLDLLVRIKDSLGHRLKLDDVAKATLNYSKSGHGLQAVEWYKQGEWDKIEKYCLDDVKITREVFEFGLKNKQLFYPDLQGIKPFPVDFTMPEVTEEELELAGQVQMSLL
ncbi:MAG: hypothetical protein CMI52_03540 [Parcubacteria group bacterium]|nr:hypothetical protein [Parcubacteria group bacterium]|tara:strand:+ start:79 stop:666 length:588 start_codon:yes stop_codon:yes gene_type:complete